MTNQTNEIDEWQLKALQTKYKGTYDLALTIDQAKKIYSYEQDKDIHSDKHYFSVWEEWDYELTTFKEILNDEQFKKYEAFLNKNIQLYEQSLIEQDIEQSNENAYLENLLHFYETRFLPDFFKDPFLRFGFLSDERAKIEYLRAEYKRFLNDTKKEILSSHFRHNKTLKPNELKTSLLRHKLLYIFPEYNYFKHQMDEPTKAIALFLNKKFRYLPDTIEELLTRKFKELRDFNDENRKKYYNDTRGWHVVVVEQQTDEEEKELRSMTLLLLDEGKYGC